MKVYLAGPEVFLPNAREVLDKKIKLAREAGFDPLTPGDLEVSPAPTKRELGENISRVNNQMMMAADGIIANLTPFRGPSADPGTVFELGFMCGRGKAAFAYSNVTETHYKRLAEFYDGQVAVAPDGNERGPDGSLVEDLDMNDNLMLDGGIAARGGTWVTHDAPGSSRFSDTTAFEKILKIAASRLLDR